MGATRCPISITAYIGSRFSACLPAVLPTLQPVMVEEPAPEEAVQWLRGLRGRYERYHGVRFTDAALSTGGWISVDFALPLMLHKHILPAAGCRSTVAGCLCPCQPLQP